MKSILLTAVLAVIGSASKIPVVSYSNVFDLGLPADYGTASALYDINFGYGLESKIEQGDQ